MIGWACIAYSVFYALIPTFNPKMVYSRLTDMMTYFVNYRSKTKNLIYLACSILFTISLYGTVIYKRYPQTYYQYTTSHLINLKEIYSREIVLLTVKFEETHKQIIKELDEENK